MRSVIGMLVVLAVLCGTGCDIHFREPTAAEKRRHRRLETTEMRHERRAIERAEARGEDAGSRRIRYEEMRLHNQIRPLD
jgi:hypothetical protein